MRLYILIFALAILLPAGVYAWFTDVRFRRRLRPNFLVDKCQATIVKKDHEKENEVSSNRLKPMRNYKVDKPSRNMIFEVDGKQILLLVDKTTYDTYKEKECGILMYKGKDFYSFEKLEKTKASSDDAF